MLDAAKKKAKQKWAIDKPMLDTAKYIHNLTFSRINCVVILARRVQLRFHFRFPDVNGEGRRVCGNIDDCGLGAC